MRYDALPQPVTAGGLRSIKANSLTQITVAFTDAVPSSYIQLLLRLIAARYGRYLHNHGSRGLRQLRRVAADHLITEGDRCIAGSYTRPSERPPPQRLQQ